MNKKKFISVLLAIAVVITAFSLGGCDSSSDSDTKRKKSKKSSNTTENIETNIGADVTEGEPNLEGNDKPQTDESTVGEEELQSKEKDSLFTYYVYETYVEIGAYSGDSKTVIIPETYNDLPVKSIGEMAFYSNTRLTSVTLPDNLVNIGKGAFSYCKYLPSIELPDGVKAIYDATFAHCESLESITIPDSVTSIGAQAFFNCQSLSSVTIPDSVTSIGQEAFRCCYSLTSIMVDPANKDFCSVDGVLFNKDVTTLIQYPVGRTDTSYEIPDGVTQIDHYAFLAGENLVSVTIPDSVTSIGVYAFSYCRNLNSIVIPDGVTVIPKYAFLDCNALEYITLPESVTRIEDAFGSCYKLKFRVYEGSYAHTFAVNNGDDVEIIA